MTGVIIFRGAAHVVAYQSVLLVLLLGPLLGMPAREALCDRGRYVPLFKLLDDVYHTGIEMEVTTPYGVLWFFRSEIDPECVVGHYERQPALPLPASRQESVLLVPAG